MGEAIMISLIGALILTVWGGLRGAWLPLWLASLLLHAFGLAAIFSIGMFVLLGAYLLSATATALLTGTSLWGWFALLVGATIVWFVLFPTQIGGRAALLWPLGLLVMALVAALPAVAVAVVRRPDRRRGGAPTRP